MAAVIIGCGTNGLVSWDYRAAVERVTESGRVVERWRLDHRPDVSPGTEAWLLLHGSNEAGSGLIGHGVVTSEPYQLTAGTDPGAGGWFIAVAFDALLPLGEQILPRILGDALPGEHWPRADRPSLVALPPSYEPALRRVWRDYGPTTADPAEVAAGTLPPGAVSTVQVSRYERDPDARRICLAFHGTSCAACGFSFESAYGTPAAEALAVHHVVPPEMLGSGYQLDPITDLVPLCQNCHAVSHTVNPPRTVSELRGIISASGHAVRGEVVSALALQAQDDARRIMEGGHA
ncbi:5-methylcytosine-specific restriction protein A [Pseudarthrobacter defluvii]|uniref:HNH endonuclease n=1 Tax=Pseudarthrobacter defluvii TaxID=410837 RepID=UPI002783EE26|nr:HNH endonuclease [Pseudarthrobacter defluvii]MDQ0768907.1 5-methylcytosine-specific restriction protein A [Pseudarthrobacter defluvii]